MTSEPHFWQGSFIGDAEAADRLAELPGIVERALAEPLSTETVLVACDTLSRALRDPDGGVYARLMDHVTDGVSANHTTDDVLTDGFSTTARAEAAATLAELADALARPALERKLRRELGGPRPERFTRPDARETVYEAWAPVGLLVHIAPGNAATVAPLSVVEGLLAGNVNVLKTSSADTALAQHLLAELATADPTGAVGRRIVALRFPSSRQDLMRLLCAPADAVAVWGGEDAVQGVAALIPPGCRLVEWGHKISFAYLTRDAWTNRSSLAALAADVCRAEQQACSSPQVVYLDTGTGGDTATGPDTDELFAFAEQFAAVLDEVSATFPAPSPEPEADAAEQAEITTTELVARAEQHLGLTKVITADDGSWRVFADVRPALTASPLHRTIWIKPLPRQEITATLRPMRRYLQTASVGGGRADTARLSRALITAGVQRITPLGAMLDSYHGEPHDGVYALQRYSRRVSVQATGAEFSATPCLDDLIAPDSPPAAPNVPLMDKAAAQDQLRSLAPEHAQLYFRSGGTTGAPALSVFTCDDYDTQMRASAHGLLAAGFAPARDRAANLFFCGGMYGSFISFFSILERLNATQIPIAAGPDHDAIAEALVAYRVDTLFGMPSYLWQLFHTQEERLRSYGGIRKVFYGGEHFTTEQRRILTEKFGVRLIRSAAYGSTDLGPLGYQCTHARGTVHHVLTDLHTLEILDTQEDRPVPTGQPGRLVFTTRTRAGQHLERYQIGDLGRAVDGVCPCGSHTPRIELLGRYGDVFRMGTYHFNYRRFAQVAEEHLGYRGELQLVLTSDADREHLAVRLDDRYAPDPDEARTALLANIPELGSAAGAEALLACTVETADTLTFERTPTSGKLRTVIDRRATTA
ncbi:acyl-CoA reductase [Streptomyces halobius]|uniref:long-chain-fatty-acyl-CoA reductase n=1 Tax=Streptomyces halobius TaxID=2879846 RepID=A0ABY4M679_9ACTN|nr:acyl-CoA reductase [Streptomyces halobius]UQA91885.1 AMP-binding protein [Streptomyces halobius]